MESLFYRYRNITVLLVAICAQMVLLAWQIKGENNVPLVRVWAITAITPVAGMIENVRNGTTDFFGSYFALRDAREQARRMRSEADKLRIENQLLRNELVTAQRTEALLGFQSRTPSRMVGARVIGTTTGTGDRSILIDRGTSAGVRKGMAVVTPTGIIGRVLAVYPFASQVMTVSDAAFAAGVESQKSHLKGVMRGINNGQYKVDYIPGGQKLEPGEMFFTSGDDRVFPKGFPAARLVSAKETSSFQEVYVQPSGADITPEEVLVIIDPIHQEIPEAPPAPDPSPVFLAPDTPQPAPVPVDPNAPQAPVPTGRGQTTQADKLMEQYKKISDSQKVPFGDLNSAAPNFNAKPQTGVTGATASTGQPKPAAAATAPTGQPKPAAVAGAPGATGASGTVVVPKPIAPRPAATTTIPPAAATTAPPKPVPPKPVQTGTTPQP